MRLHNRSMTWLLSLRIVFLDLFSDIFTRLKSFFQLANLVDEQLSPNSTNTEATDSSKIDILSDGFKCRVADQGINNSGHTICYAAFAQNPFVTSKGVPVTAG